MKNFWCLVGRSGSGKDTLWENINKIHPEWKRVVSKTTRPKRSENENCHIFTNEAEYYEDLANGIVVAHNVYNGYHYWATTKQVEEADIYIVDIPGLRELKLKYTGRKKIMALGLQISTEESAKRMAQRGDDDVAINRRLIIDDNAFKNLNEYTDVLLACDMLLPEDVAAFADAVIQTYEVLA